MRKSTMTQPTADSLGFIDELRSALGGDVDASTRRRAEYSSDASNYRVVPEVVVFPRDVDEVVAVTEVAIGIPGNSAAAVLLGALTVHGLQPGPQLFTGSGDLVHAIFWALIIIPIVMLVAGLLGIRVWGQITRIPTRYLWPAILGLSAVGAYAVRGTIVDVVVMVGAGLLGYVMIKNGFPPAPLVIGLIVGPLAEAGFRRATIINSGSLEWIFQPIPLVLLILSILTVGAALVRTRRMQLSAQRGETPPAPLTAEDVEYEEALAGEDHPSQGRAPRKDAAEMP